MLFVVSWFKVVSGVVRLCIDLVVWVCWWGCGCGDFACGFPGISGFLGTSLLCGVGII